jgi:hypothetical protein
MTTEDDESLEDGELEEGEIVFWNDTDLNG